MISEHRRIKPSQTSETRNKKRIQALYDQLGASYAELYGEEQKEKHLSLLGETRIQPSDVCLDLGCGTGDFLARVLRKSHFAVGIDLARSMVLATGKRLRGSSNCAVVWADGEHLPFRQNSFQTLFAITVLLDPESVSRTIHETERTLCREGSAVFSMIRNTKEFPDAESAIERDLRGWEVKKMQVGRDIGWLAKKV